MKSHRMLIITAGFSALVGCAYQMQPLNINHPAHPEAMAAPERPWARTLAYTATDIPSIRPVVGVNPAQEADQPAGSSQAAAQETVVGEGKVLTTVPNAGQIVVEHGEIKGFMEAMTMGYRIDPPSLMEGLKFGDKIRFTIDVQKKAIVKIEKMK